MSENETMTPSMSIAWVIHSIARMKAVKIDRLQIYSAISDCDEFINTLQLSEEVGYAWIDAVVQVLTKMDGEIHVDISERPDPVHVPFVSCLPNLGLVIVTGLNGQNKWIVNACGKTLLLDSEATFPALTITFPPKKTTHQGEVLSIFKEEFRKNKLSFIEGGAASVISNLLALATSMYSMQVYDRVIPTQGYSTLFVLTVGVVLTLFFDLVIKTVRGYIVEDIQLKIDKRLSRVIFERLLSIRMDQLPLSVGSLSAQIRGYETIRTFLSTSTFYVLVDVPFGIVFIFLIGLITSPEVALIPLVFLCVSLFFGFAVRHKVDQHVAKSTAASNKKTGILVEAIEGAETIKSGAGGWNFLAKWLSVNEEAMSNDFALKSLSEKSMYATAAFQQVSYVLLIAIGAYIATQGHLTMGALIAASILSGRVLTPIAQIPSMLVQYSHAKTALSLLEQMFNLEMDNHDLTRPIIPADLGGNYHFKHVRYGYNAMHKGLVIPDLKISSGEKVGVIGPVGAGKSTLLRLLSGMYKPSEGRVLLDGLDVEQISRHCLAEHIGYIQQEHRLFSGTLRENLLIGIPDPGDEVIKEAARSTGLLSIIASHPHGLDLMIAEGGKGLSGGQRQLVALTRLLITKPGIWLLDEPTASLDPNAEETIRQLLHHTIQLKDTLVLVTHKPQLLSLVDRVIVIANNAIVLDGPKDPVLQKLSSNP